jgi:MinD-like ATPase involved in chromosome partitioning or flagellar assembly
MEIIAFASGKGGTGKTLMASCLGYALIQAGHRVLMIDGDPATDGLSLFLLGPKGTKQIKAFEQHNTFTGILRSFQKASVICEPRRINRATAEDHGISYEALISGRGLYGDDSASTDDLAVPDLDQQTFRQAVSELFGFLKGAGHYDYVIVDTRGGFAFESTDVCALADSLIVVTEPDFTSFHQDRNLIRRISAASQQLGSKTLLRAVIVNKATETEQGDKQIDLRKMEASFRLELTKEFPIHFEDTYPVPVDIEALKAYKTQRIPYRVSPASLFSFATLSAFSDILQVVTAPWTQDHIKGWNQLVTQVSEAVESRNTQLSAETEKRKQQDQEALELRRENRLLQEVIEQLKREIDRTQKSYERSQRLQEQIPTSSSISINPPVLAKKRGILGVSWRVWLTTILVALFLEAGAVIFWRVNRSNEQNRIEDLVTKVYNVSLPVVLRRMYLEELISKYRRTVFDQIDFKNADLHGIDLEGGSFRSANFTDANLSKADFRYADLSGADFTGADIRGASFFKASIYDRELAGSFFDEKTVFPDGSTGHIYPEKRK